MSEVVVAADAENRDYDRLRELKEFDDARAGIKGLLDAGLVKIPKLFINPPDKLQKDIETAKIGSFVVPVIDLGGLHNEIVDAICKASETWGVFHMINHGISTIVMNELLDAIRRFHEQPKEVKMEWYSRDSQKKVRFYSNGRLYESKTVDWRDSIYCNYMDGRLDSKCIPLVCRKEIEEYMKGMIRVKTTLCEVISEALGLTSDQLARMECAESQTLLCHYYPYCPEPDMAIGSPRHTDPCFLTVLLQDKIGGLQVLHQNRYVDVTPLEGALVVNMGDLLQLITNNRFKSVEHRVLVSRNGPRISATCMFHPSSKNMDKPYGPIKQFLSNTNPPVYIETSFPEYLRYQKSIPLDGAPALHHFKL